MLNPLNEDYQLINKHKKLIINILKAICFCFFKFRLKNINPKNKNINI